MSISLNLSGCNKKIIMQDTTYCHTHTHSDFQLQYRAFTPPAVNFENTHLHTKIAIETGYSRFLESKAATMMANATCWIWIPK